MTDTPIERLKGCPWCKAPGQLHTSNDREISWVACPNGHCKASGPLEWSEEAAATAWNTRATIEPIPSAGEGERVRREALEEAAKVADMLGGVRDRLPLREGNDSEAKFRRHNRGQHVRAATIAKAIRLLATLPSEPLRDD